MEEPGWYPTWDALCQRMAAHGYSSLSDDEKIWVNVRALMDSTHSGGLISFFYNSYADTLPDCMRALETLGAHDILTHLRRVCALFGDTVPLDINARNELISSWPDEGVQAEAIDGLLEEVDEALYELFEALENRLDAFLKESGLAT
jgi:hypothetical protein